MSLLTFFFENAPAPPVMTKKNKKTKKIIKPINFNFSNEDLYTIKYNTSQLCLSYCQKINEYANITEPITQESIQTLMINIVKLFEGFKLVYRGIINNSIENIHAINLPYLKTYITKMAFDYGEEFNDILVDNSNNLFEKNLTSLSELEIEEPLTYYIDNFVIELKDYDLSYTENYNRIYENNVYLGTKYFRRDVSSIFNPIFDLSLDEIINNSINNNPSKNLINLIFPSDISNLIVGTGISYE